MNKIYLKGDFHGQLDMFPWLNTKHFPAGQTLTRDDYLVCLGDFGVVWTPRYKKEEAFCFRYLNENPWTTLVVPGNHENYNRLYSDEFSDVSLFGGKAKQLSEHVFLLLNGEIYKIGDKRILVFGGATSIDKESRKENISWWPQEIPSSTDFYNARQNLEKCQYKVDYVFSHTCPTHIVDQLKLFPDKRDDPVCRMLDCIFENLEFKHWYFGHFHLDKKISDKFTVSYHTVLKI